VNRTAAIRFILLAGLISFFADITYEGARGVTGPFLAMLGAGAVVVGAVSGAGEFLGNALRLVSGYLIDRTRSYWGFAILGYVVNLASIPLLAFARRWETAAALILLERTGKAIRTPARDAMLSHASAETGRGWGFGIHEAMDQAGALLGPLLVAAVLAAWGSYRAGFALLAVPALAAMLTLFAAKRMFPDPRGLEVRRDRLETASFPRAFWLYLGAAGLMAAGFVDFPLVAYHFKVSALASDTAIPLIYALAMGVDALAALGFGRLFDRFGILVLVAAALAASLAAPLLFLGALPGAVTGMILWGVALGAIESVMRAAVAGMTPAHRRGSAYGLFHATYGLLWFAGSALLGALYTPSIKAVAAVSAGLQLASIPVFLAARRALERTKERQS